MAGYVTTTTVFTYVDKRRIAKLSNDEASEDIDTTILQKAIDWGKTIIDSFLAHIYGGTTISGSELVMSMNADLARLFLERRRGQDISRELSSIRIQLRELATKVTTLDGALDLPVITGGAEEAHDLMSRSGYLDGMVDPREDEFE